MNSVFDSVTKGREGVGAGAGEIVCLVSCEGSESDKLL